MYGLDLLGLGSKHFKIPKWPDGVALGVFDSTWPDNFGDPYRKVRKILATGKCPAVRIHLYWSYQHVGAPLDIVRKAIPRWEKLAREFPNVKFYLSPSCEYKTASKQLVEGWVNSIRTLAPSCTPVLSSWGGPVVNGVITEVHGDKTKAKPGQIVSTDGDSLFDADATKWKVDNSKALIAFGWGLRFNCAQTGTNPPPCERTKGPSQQYVDSVVALFSDGACGNLKKPELWKTHAEDKSGNSDPRANKPCLIIKQKAAFVEVVQGGKVIGKLPYYGTYTGGLHRYYSGLPGGINKYAYELGDGITLRVGKRIIKLDSAKLRQGFYQS